MTKARELADLIANVNNGSSLANKNLVINGAMNVNQRSVSSTSEGYQTVDRFFITINAEDNLAFTQAQSTDAPTGFSNSYKIDCTTVESALASDELAYVAYKTEAQDCMITLNGTADAKPLTLSFWVKSNKTGTYAITLYKPDNTARSLGKTYTISSANTWEYKTVTFEGDTSGGGLDDNNDEGLSFYFTLMAGSDWTSSDGTSWHNYANASFSYGHNVNMFDNTANEWLLTGVQLEIGEKATEFEHEPFETTLNKCYRYYFRMEGQDFGGGKISTHYRKRSGTGYFYNDTAFLAHYVLPVPMRIAPTALEQSGTDSDIDVAYRGTVSTPSGGVVTFNDATNHYFTTYHPNHSDNNATGEFGMQRIRQAAGLLAVSAEL